MHEAHGAHGQPPHRGAPQQPAGIQRARPTQTRSAPSADWGLEAFDLSSAATEDDQTYDGAATLTLAGARFRVRVRLTGHLDPIDGNYHWQGTVFDSLPETSLTHARAATLTIGGRSAPARITEQTPWGTHSVAGVGPPPYARSGPASATT